MRLSNWMHRLYYIRAVYYYDITLLLEKDGSQKRLVLFNVFLQPVAAQKDSGKCNDFMHDSLFIVSLKPAFSLKLLWNEIVKSKIKKHYTNKRELNWTPIHWFYNISAFNWSLFHEHRRCLQYFHVWFNCLGWGRF